MNFFKYILSILFFLGLFFKVNTVEAICLTDEEKSFLQNEEYYNNSQENHQLGLTSSKGNDKLAITSNSSSSILESSLVLGFDEVPLGSQLKEILDDAGNRIQDSYGNYLAEMSQATGEFGQSILVITKRKGVAGAPGTSGFSLFNENVIKRLDDLQDAQLKASFLNDFANASEDVIEQINLKPELVNSWKVLNDIGTNAAWRKSSDLLTKVSSILDDAELSAIIKGSGSGTPSGELTKILSTLQANPCKIRPNSAPGNSSLLPIETILDDLAVASKNLPNYSVANIVAQFKIPGLAKNRGWAFELRQTVRKNIAEAQHGKGILNAQNGSKYDMASGSNFSKYDEFKSTEHISGNL